MQMSGFASYIHVWTSKWEIWKSYCCIISVPLRTKEYKVEWNYSIQIHKKSDREASTFGCKYYNTKQVRKLARGIGRQKLGGLITKPLLECPETNVRDTYTKKDHTPKTGQSLSGKSSDGPTSFSVQNADFIHIHKCL